MQRYSFYQFNGSTFVVIDQIEQREICVCSDYDDKEDAEERAKQIALLLNKNME
jgi:hypothetical protein